MKITVKDIMSKTPCNEWTEERLRKHIGEGKTLLQICRMGSVDIAERIWCVTRFLDDKTNRAFAIWCARQCKADKKEITEYIDVIERYYDGKSTDEEVKAADWVAYWAVGSEADSAAYWAAYWAVGWAADWAVGREADWAAYCAADSAADQQSMRRKQIKKLTEMVSER